MICHCDEIDKRNELLPKRRKKGDKRIFSNSLRRYHKTSIKTISLFEKKSMRSEKKMLEQKNDTPSIAINITNLPTE
jgi:hypothetical protein